MTDLRTVAQAVLKLYDADCDIDAHMEALRQALDSPVEPVAVVFEEFDSQVHYVETTDSKLRLPVGTKLYTTPPSVDALIAEAVAKEREACAQIAMDFWCDAGAVAIRARGQK